MPECAHDCAEVAVLTCQLRAAHHRIDQLQQAIESRGRIGQALGVLMCRYAIDAEAAFATMTRVSQHHNVKLRELAEAVLGTITCRGEPVTHGLRPALEELLVSSGPQERRKPGPKSGLPGW